MLTLNDGRSELWQYDTGRTLAVDADCSQVHFSNKVFGRSVDVDVVDGVAIIPDILLQTDKDLNVWAFFGTAEKGYTKISKTFKVNKRNKPADYVFTPPEQTTLAELVERLDTIEENQDHNAIENIVKDYLDRNPVEVPVQSVNGQTGKVDLTSEDVGAISKDDLQEATNKALAQAKASGEFNGRDGNDGKDYVLTDADKSNIAEMAAELMNVDLTGYATETWVQEGYQPKGDYLTDTQLDPVRKTANEANQKVDTLRGIVSKFHSNIVEEVNGDIITLDDASDMELAGLNVYGKTTQNGTPTPEAPVPLESVGDGGSVTVSIGISETDENLQTLTISTPNGLPGIPVTSGGNYTDENGQQWICDYVDFAKGVYVQRVLYAEVGAENFLNISDSRALAVQFPPAPDYYDGICSHARFIKGFSNSFGDCGVNSLGTFMFATDKTDINDFKEWLGTDKIKVFVNMQSDPIEHDLTEDELAQYAALHTNYPNTTIVNDGGAGMEVKYVADTKLYIDKKFAELSTVLLNQ